MKATSQPLLWYAVSLWIFHMCKRGQSVSWFYLPQSCSSFSLIKTSLSHIRIYWLKSYQTWVWKISKKAELWVLCYFHITSDNAHFTLNITGPSPYLNSEWHTEEKSCTEKQKQNTNHLLLGYRDVVLCGHVGHDLRKVH